MDYRLHQTMFMPADGRLPAATHFPKMMITILKDAYCLPFGPPFLPNLALARLAVQGEVAPNPELQCDDRSATDGIRASRRQHPIQHRDADGRLGLLGGETAGAQPRPD